MSLPSQTLMWRSASRVHDWTDRAFPLALLTQAEALGILMRVDWFATEGGGARRNLPSGGRGSLAEQLLAQVRPRARVGYLEAGADGENPWRLHLLLPKTDRSGQRVDGMSVAALQFDGQAFAPTAGSAQLAAGFRAVHSPVNTEYAGLHWHDDWQRLRDTTYARAVTYDPMFSGVVWANFLGPCHIDQFDRTMLQALPSTACHWMGDQGLFLMMQSSLVDTRGAAAEAELARLTDIFRAARVRSINPGVT